MKILTFVIAITLWLASSQSGSCFYNSSTGRWLSRDPIGERGGRSLSAFVMNNSVNSFDPDGRITVTRLSLSPGSCVAYDVKWKFELERPAGADGYMVQQVDYHESVTNCAGGVTNWSKLSWEAWPFEANHTLFKEYSWGNYSDVAFSAEHPDTSGHISAKGTIKFFHLGTTSNLGDLGIPPPAPSVAYGVWWPNASGMSGLLPSTNIRPDWWSNPSMDPEASREVNVYWDCCCGILNYNLIISEP